MLCAQSQFTGRVGVNGNTIVDKGLTTDYRTAAAGAYTSRLLAKNDSKKVGVIGTGIQAHLQIEVLSYVFKFEEVHIWGRDPSKVEAYIIDMKELLPEVDFIKADSPKDASSNVDILITTTYATSPIVKSEWISSGTHIVAVGACGPEMQEHEVEVLLNSDKVYVDSIEKASLDGELHHVLEQGRSVSEAVHGELGDVILGKVTGRERNDEITFVDLVGLGIQDATAAEYMMSQISY